MALVDCQGAVQGMMMSIPEDWYHSPAQLRTMRHGRTNQNFIAFYISARINFFGLSPEEHIEHQPPFPSPDPPLSQYQLRSQQTPPISINHRARHVPIPHNIQITLRHVLGPPHLPSCAPALRAPQDRLPPLPRHTVPKRRQHRPRTHEVDPDGREVEREVPRHAVQARRVARDDGPVLVRLPAHGARRQGDGRAGAGVQVGGRVLGEQEGGVEADHGGALDVGERGVGELDGREGVAGRVDDVVEFLRVGPVAAAAASVEEGDDVGCEGWGG